MGVHVKDREVDAGSSGLFGKDGVVRIGAAPDAEPHARVGCGVPCERVLLPLVPGHVAIHLRQGPDERAINGSEDTAIGAGTGLILHRGIGLALQECADRGWFAGALFERGDEGEEIVFGHTVAKDRPWLGCKPHLLFAHPAQVVTEPGAAIPLASPLSLHSLSLGLGLRARFPCCVGVLEEIEQARVEVENIRGHGGIEHAFAYLHCCCSLLGSEMGVDDAVVPVAIEKAEQTVLADADGRGGVHERAREKIEDRWVIGLRLLTRIEWNAFAQEISVARSQDILGRHPQQPKLEVAGAIDAGHGDAVADNGVREGAVGLHFFQRVTQHFTNVFGVGEEEGQDMLQGIARGAL